MQLREIYFRIAHYPWSWLLALAMAAVLSMMATTASAQSSAFVPGTASGGFGYPIVDGVVPLVTAVR
jgi:hypothetical protein